MADLTVLEAELADREEGFAVLEGELTELEDGLPVVEVELTELEEDFAVVEVEPTELEDGLPVVEAELTELEEDFAVLGAELVELAAGFTAPAAGFVDALVRTAWAPLGAFVLVEPVEPVGSSCISEGSSPWNEDFGRDGAACFRDEPDVVLAELDEEPAPESVCALACESKAAADASEYAVKICRTKNSWRIRLFDEMLAILPGVTPTVYDNGAAKL